jgi:hypothetical protein
MAYEYNMTPIYFVVDGYDDLAAAHWHKALASLPPARVVKKSMKRARVNPIGL